MKRFITITLLFILVGSIFANPKLTKTEDVLGLTKRTWEIELVGEVKTFDVTDIENEGLCLITSLLGSQGKEIICYEKYSLSSVKNEDVLYLLSNYNGFYQYEKSTFGDAYYWEFYYIEDGEIVYLWFLD